MAIKDGKITVYLTVWSDKDNEPGAYGAGVTLVESQKAGDKSRYKFNKANPENQLMTIKTFKVPITA